MLKLSDNIRSTVVSEASKKEQDEDAPVFIQNKKIKRVFDENSRWTSFESDVLKEVMAEYFSDQYFSDQYFKWSIIRSILESRGIFKTNKQILQRWNSIDSPSIIPRILHSHKIKLLCLASCYVGQWSALSKFIKGYNSGFTYSENSIKNLYNQVKRSKKNNGYQEEQEEIWKQYPGLSKEQANIEIAKSLKLNELKDEAVVDSIISRSGSLVSLNIYNHQMLPVASENRSILNRAKSSIEYPRSLIEDVFSTHFVSLDHARVEESVSVQGDDDPNNVKDHLAEERRPSVVSSSSESQAQQAQIKEEDSDLAQGEDCNSSEPFRCSRRKRSVDALCHSNTRWNNREKEIFFNIFKEFNLEFFKENIDWDKITAIANLRGVNRSSSEIRMYWENSGNFFIVRSMNEDRKIKVACIIEHLNSSWEDRSRFIKNYNEGYYYTGTKIRDLTRSKTYLNILHKSRELWDEYVLRFGDKALEMIARDLHLDKVELEEDIAPFDILGIPEGYEWDVWQEGGAGALDTSSEMLDSDFHPLDVCKVSAEIPESFQWDFIEEQHLDVVDLE